MSHSHVVGLPHDRAYQAVMTLFEELTFPQRMRRMFEGLAQPRGSGEYKFAQLQLQRLSAPFLATLLPILLVLLLVVVANTRPPKERILYADLPEPTTNEPPLEEPPELPNSAVPVAPEPPGVAFAPKPPDIPAGGADALPPPEVPKPWTAVGRLFPMDAPPRRGPKALGPGVGLAAPGLDVGPTSGSESMVERALRWLKTRQQADGAWLQHKDAMTALAVLTFLSHGERPGESAEFGDTVLAGIQYLLRSQRADGTWPGNYEQPIATYALCEAYGMTLNPTVKAAAEKAVLAVLRGQHPSGGWDYGMKQSGRDDTSVMGWTAQALKAARVSNVLDDNELLDKACKLAVQGFLANAGPQGGFGYTEPGAGGLSSVGTLCLQLLGSGRHEHVRKTLDLMDDWVLSWNDPKVPGKSPQYYFYYATQAKFFGGGARWKTWNAAMVSEYAKAQKVVPKEQSGYVDAEGAPRAIGWWENADQHSDRPVMDTCLAAIQLMVYYRYLPTFRSPELESERLTTEADEVVVVIRL